ncbi:MAG TPA: hypothetical protein VNL70_06355 [Tepidisphaeraceae bacterium]|nr:hypothetical protein [Tepidisphaeraceae bacterium]
MEPVVAGGGASQVRPGVQIAEFIVHNPGRRSDRSSGAMIHFATLRLLSFSLVQTA